MSSVSDVADSPGLVLSVYFPLLIPLGLYAGHDILDGRWRFTPYHLTFAVLYLGVFLIGALGVTGYAVTQAIAHDWKETGASALALALAVNAFLKLLRIFRILRTHGKLMDGAAARLDRLLVALFPDAVPHVDVSWTRFYWLWLTRRVYLDCPDDPKAVTAHHPGAKVRVPRRARGRPRGHRIYLRNPSEHERYRRFLLSSAVFDDDFQSNDSARVSWFRPRVTIHENDSDEAALRLALLLHLVLCAGKYRFLDRLLKDNRPLYFFESAPRVSLAGMLRRLVTFGSHQPAPAVDYNAAQTLLRNPYQKLDNIGRSIFWIATMSSREDIDDALSRFPPSWRRAPRADAPDIMFEACAMFVLSSVDWEKVDESQLVSKFLLLNRIEVRTPHLLEVSSGEDHKRTPGETRSACSSGTSLNVDSREVSEGGDDGNFDEVETHMKRHVSDSAELGRLSLAWAQAIDDCLPRELKSEMMRDGNLWNLVPGLEHGSCDVEFVDAVRNLVGIAMEKIKIHKDESIGIIWMTVLEDVIRSARMSGCISGKIVNEDDIAQAESDLGCLHGGVGVTRLFESSEVVWGIISLATSLKWVGGKHVQDEIQRWLREFSPSDDTATDENLFAPASQRYIGERIERDLRSWHDEFMREAGMSENMFSILQRKLDLDAEDIFALSPKNWKFGRAGQWMMSCKNETCPSYSSAFLAYLKVSSYLARGSLMLLFDLASLEPSPPSSFPESPVAHTSSKFESAPFPTYTRLDVTAETSAASESADNSYFPPILGSPEEFLAKCAGMQHEHFAMFDGLVRSA